MFSTLSVLATSLHPKRSSATIASAPQGLGKSVCVSTGTGFSGRRRNNGLARLKKLCAYATGATVRFVTGPTSKPPEASFASACSTTPPNVIDLLGRSPAFLSPNPVAAAAVDGSTRARLSWRLSRIGCHPRSSSAISPVAVAVEQPLSSAEQVTVVNPQPYFVPSTASAAEILTHVALQDLLFASSSEEEDDDDDDAGFFDSSSSTSSRDTLVNPFAHDEYSDLDSEGVVEVEGEDAEDGDEPPPPESSSPEPKPDSEPTTDLSNWFRDPSEHLQLPSPVHTNEEIRHTSTSVVEVTFRNARPDSDSPGDDHGDGEQAIIIPVTPSIFTKPYPHPHRLSPVIEQEEEEDCPSPETSDGDDEDDTSDAETIRPSTFFPRGARLREEDAGMDGPSGRSSFPFPLPRGGESTARVRTDRRMSI